VRNNGFSRRQALTALSGMGLAACNRRAKRTIAVIPKATSSVFFVAVEAGARAAGKEFNLEILWNGAPLETDYARQIQIVDSMVARHVDGIALAATERKALVGPMDRALAAGIPVTIFDSGLDSTNYLSYVATDNVEAGRLAARTLGKLLAGKGTAAMIMHAPGSASTMDREKGFNEVMARDFSGIQIVASQFGSGDRAKSMAVTENILTAHPELNGIFASSEPSSVGAAHAIKARGLSGKIKLVSFDSSEGLIEDLKGGTIDAMIVQDPYKMGYEAVKTLADKLNGKTPPKRLDLAAVVVTKADLDRPEMKKLLNIPG
jgi:ABC-type sugar transport system, periplasmic component